MGDATGYMLSQNLHGGIGVPIERASEQLFVLPDGDFAPIA